MPRQHTSRRFVAAAILAGAFALSAGCDRGAAKATNRAADRMPGVTTVPATQRAATTTADAAPGVERTLFERLGGTPGVTKVVDDFVALAAADPKVNFTRKGQPTAWDPTPQNVASLKKRLVEFVATTTGGDVTYHGKDMVSAHKGMNITDAEFDAIAADLKTAMDRNDVPAREQAELLAVVNRTRSAIVPEPKQHAPIVQDAKAGNPADAPKVPDATPEPAAERPAPFVPQPVTSDETELDDEPAPAKAAPAELNK